MTVSKVETNFFKVKARTNHFCSICGASIKSGDIYYKEGPKDKFLQTLHAKNVCTMCYKNKTITNIRQNPPKSQRKLKINYNK
ncbi:MAG: hypothetical protein QXS81_05285 [Candidatus Micrarchaeaceae archaeon]